MSWVETYQQTDTMDISDLKEVLKTLGLPFAGKKRDLISHFIFYHWKDMIPPPTIKDRGLWLQKLYFSKVSFPHDAINNKNLFNRVIILSHRIAPDHGYHYDEGEFTK